MPRPVHIGRKARKGIVEEACLDIVEVSEDFHDCVSPEQLIEAQEAVAKYIAFVRELDSGELSSWNTVDRTQKLIEAERDRVSRHIGEVTAVVTDPDKDKVRGMEAEIRREVKQATRLSRAWQECSRWRCEYLDEQRDKEAAERLSVEPSRG